MEPSQALRIALLSYRGQPHSGGQGVYVRHLSRSLEACGHSVEVFSGPPYPDLDDGVSLTKVPSLDLYRPDDPFRRPRRHEFRDWIDVLEYGLMCTAAFPEPLTFGLRVARTLRRRSAEFDVVHDNQSLGYGLLGIARLHPTVATVHHPVSLDRDVEVARAPDRRRRTAMRRWYGFTRMQARVARRLPRLIAVSESSRDDVVREYGIPPERVDVVHNGVDPDFFRPLEHVRKVPGRVVTVASADVPIKGLDHLIEAIAKLRTERDVDLTVIGNGGVGRRARAAVRRFGVEDCVRCVGRVDALRLPEEYARAEIAVVPSLYEGFSLPAIEAMACGLPLVATTGGALPEVVGREAGCGALVPPGDAGAMAAAIARFLDAPGLRAQAGAAGRRRVLERFDWAAAARATAAVYANVLRC